VGSFALSVLLVDRADHLEPSPAPLVSDVVGTLTVDIERTGHGLPVAIVFGEMNRQISVAMRESVRVVVKADLKSHPGVVVRRPRYVAHFKDWLDSAHLPAATMRVHLMVSLCVEPAKAVVTDLYLAVRVKLHGGFTSLPTT
jgi:hypothetical protein